MARTQKYKKIEKNFANNIQNKSASFLKIIKNSFVKIFKIFDSKLTIMIVPHSQGKVLNIQTNVFALTLAFILAIGVISSFVYFNRKAVVSNAEITRDRKSVV